jgi:putative transposase
VSANQATLPVRVLCRLLSVSPSGSYAWRERTVSARARADMELSALIQQAFERSHRTYGYRRIQVELREVYGKRVSGKRIKRLMKRAGLKGVHKRRFICTTRPGPEKPEVPDLVERCFEADRPNALWLADVTYVSTEEGFLYVAAVLDVFSRLIVGWAMQARVCSALVLTALEMAYAQRSPREVIHHSDHGSEFTAVVFGSRSKKLSIRLSMGSKGDCYDNAMMESFWASLECEVLDRNRFKTREQARRAVFSWIEGWYNTHRRHSGIGYISPREFEQRYAHKH